MIADRRRIVQVLGNLLSNAARHSPAGYLIRVQAAPRGVQVEISVSEDGAGIAAERLLNQGDGRRILFNTSDPLVAQVSGNGELFQSASYYQVIPV